MKIGVIGGGAAGFFYAANRKLFFPEDEITIYEQGKEVLSKVRISGGGRCNVTHGCWDPRELTQYYPRGHRELLGPFHTFACGDTMEWFDSRGVSLKIEDDGRVFPVSNKSASIIDCLTEAAKGVDIRLQSKVQNISPKGDTWTLHVQGMAHDYDRLFIAPGSSKYFWNILGELGHTIHEPVPSLFTFNIKDSRISGLPGLSVPHAQVQVNDSILEASGPLLITHWGLSGPGILRLSAYGALEMHAWNYDFEIEVDWIPHIDEEALWQYKQDHGGKNVFSKGLFDIPTRLWQSLLDMLNIHAHNWADLNKNQMTSLIEALKATKFEVKGKSTFKDEFVTAGGIDLKEVNFKDFSSKVCPGLYFGGEVLNIDAVTGGFNFQAAWTGAYLASLAD